MQEKHLYEYAVIRVVPRVEREEFVNVGIIMYSKRPKFIKARYILEESKLSLFSSELEIDVIKNNLQSFDKICSGIKEGGAIAAMEIQERFRWLTAVRSASIQTSVARRGFSSDLDSTFEKLYTELVL